MNSFQLVIWFDANFIHNNLPEKPLINLRNYSYKRIFFQNNFIYFLTFLHRFVELKLIVITFIDVLSLSTALSFTWYTIVILCFGADL